MIAPADLAAIRQRAEAATKGPWRVAYSESTHRAGSPICLERCVKKHEVPVRVEPFEANEFWPAGEGHVMRDKDYVDDIIGGDESHVFCAGHDYDEGGVVGPEDAEFIAHAREDIPALLETVDALTQALAHSTEYLQQSFAIPHCPACGSSDGSLGTSYAYFICRECHAERYWTPDHQHPGDWRTAIAASPWAREREQRERAEAAESKVAELTAAFAHSTAQLTEAQQKKKVPLRKGMSSRLELQAFLDMLVITSDNIGDIRRQLFTSCDSSWNSWVRDDTAIRELSTEVTHARLLAAEAHVADLARQLEALRDAILFAVPKDARQVWTHCQVLALAACHQQDAETMDAHSEERDLIKELKSQLAQAKDEHETLTVDQIKSHWFTQGGTMRFGDIDGGNADEIVSSILTRLRPDVLALERDAANEVATIWRDKLAAKTVALEAAEVALRRVSALIGERATVWRVAAGYEREHGNPRLANGLEYCADDLEANVLSHSSSPQEP